MRVTVTGSHGQLAKSLAERAAAYPEIQLISLARTELDLEQPDLARNVVASSRPDILINAAAWTAVDEAEDSPERAFRINAESAGELAAAAAEAGARVVQISTDYVFDGGCDEPYTEESPTNPLSIYGRSKLAGEERVRAANPDHVIVRTAWLYSPFGCNFVKTIIGAAEARDILKVVNDQCGSPSSAHDVADGLFRMIDVWKSHPDIGVGETFHLAGPETATWFELAQAVMNECRRVGLPVAEVLPIATADWPTKAARPRCSVLNSGKFARVFNHAMPGWRTSLATVVERLAG